MTALPAIADPKMPMVTPERARWVAPGNELAWAPHVVAEVLHVTQSRPDEDSSCRILAVLLHVRPDDELTVVLDRDAYDRQAMRLHRRMDRRRRRWWPVEPTSKVDVLKETKMNDYRRQLMSRTARTRLRLDRWEVRIRAAAARVSAHLPTVDLPAVQRNLNRMALLLCLFVTLPLLLLWLAVVLL